MAVGLAFPQTEVNVCSTASLIQPGLGREGCEQTCPAGHTAHSFPHQADVISRAQHISVADRKLLLRGTKLGMEQLDRDALVLQLIQNRIDGIRLLVQANAAIAEATIGWHVGPVLLAS